MNPNESGERHSYPGPGFMAGVLLGLLPLLASVVLYGLCLLLAPAAHPAAAANAQPVWGVDRRVEEAVLAEDWAKVARLLGPVDGRTPSPVVRLIQAHAYLALNRNNESFCLFRSVSSENDRKQWLEWSHKFAAQNGGSVIAHYFKGDALARLGHWDAALAAFNEALRLRPKHPLTLNARGITYAALGRWGPAVVDFDEAARANPTFADAYASRGAMYIQKKAGAEGALKWFDYALKKEISPNFALALNGRGGAQFALGEWEKAREDLVAAREKLTCDGSIVEENFEKIVEYMNGQAGTQLAELSPEDAGTTLDKRFETLKSNPSQWNANRFTSDLRGQPQGVQDKYLGMMKDHAAKNPQWGNTVNGNLDRIQNWNRPGGGGELWSGLIPKSIGIGVGKGNVNIGGLGMQDHQLGATRGNFDMATKMQSLGMGDGKLSGGVTTKGKTHLDDGEWPVVTCYGLAYPVKFETASSTNKE